MIPISRPVLDGNEKKYIQKCLDDGWISSKGSFINRFEELNTNYYNIDYGVAVANGTVALHLALLTLGIGGGDEVIVPDFTFASTANAVIHAGAKPILCDIDLDTWNIDIKKCENLVTSRTKAIIPVHLYGNPCDMEKIKKFAKCNDLYIIEDCAEAHGAKYNNKKIGTFSDISCFSFYGNKIITTGEGGICLTNNIDLYKKMKILRDHGMDPNRRYWHNHIGFNYRMTNMQAAIGCAQIERIDEIIEERQRIEKRYDNNLLGNLAFIKQKVLKKSINVCWLYNIKFDQNIKISKINNLRNYLKKNKIETRPFFTPIHKMPPYIKYIKSDIKNSEKIYKYGFSLPTFVGLKNKKIDLISNLIINYRR